MQGNISLQRMKIYLRYITDDHQYADRHSSDCYRLKIGPARHLCFPTESNVVALTMPVIARIDAAIITHYETDVIYLF